MENVLSDKKKSSEKKSPNANNSKKEKEKNKQGNNTKVPKNQGKVKEVKVVEVIQAPKQSSTTSKASNKHRPRFGKVKQSELKAKLGEIGIELPARYGPPIAVDHEFGGIDLIRSYTFIVQDYWIAHVCLAICAHAASVMPEQLTTQINMAYVYNFLARYMRYVISGVNPTQSLQAAPTVFWDILYALRPRKRGNVHFNAVGVQANLSNNFNDPTTANTINCPLGLASGGLTNGFITLNTALASYTDQLGYTSTILLFDSCAKLLDCVSIVDYPDPFKHDEVSIFAFNSTPVGGGVIGYWSSNGSSQFDVLKSASILGPKSCEWLMRLALPPIPLITNAYHPYASGYSISVPCSPGAMVIHRIINKLRGYQGHQTYPIVKGVDITHFMSTWDIMYNQLVLSAALATPPAVTAAVGPIDFKVLSYLCVARYFTRWQALSLGMTLNGGSNDRFASCGSYQLPIEFDTYVMPLLLGMNAASLYPYTKGSATIYPCLYISADFTVATSANYNASNLCYTGAWNLLTNITGTAEVAVACMKISNPGQMLQNWAALARICGPYLSYSPPVDEGVLCSAQVSRFTDTTTGINGLLIGESYPHMPEHIKPTIAKCIVPAFPISDVSRRTMVMSIYGEHDYAMLSQYAISEINYVAGALITAIHISGGFGNSLAPVPTGFNKGGTSGTTTVVSSGTTTDMMQAKKEDGKETPSDSDYRDEDEFIWVNDRIVRVVPPSKISLKSLNTIQNGPHGPAYGNGKRASKDEL